VGLMMLPAVAARFFSRQIGPMMTIATVIGLLSGVIGLLISYHVGLPTGPAIILTAGVILLGSVLFGPQDGILTSRLPRPHLES